MPAMIQANDKRQREMDIENAVAAAQSRSQDFYKLKHDLRRRLKKPPLIEILPRRITVIDHDMTKHTI